MLPRSGYTNKLLLAAALGRVEEFISLFPSLADECAGLTGVLGPLRSSPHPGLVCVGVSRSR